MVTDAEGRLYVADSRLGLVTVFDSLGQHAGTIGADDGDGSLAMPMALAWSPDSTLWVMDPGSHGYKAYDRQGSFRRAVRRPPTMGREWPWPGGFLGDTLLDSSVAPGGARSILGLSLVDDDARVLFSSRHPYQLAGFEPRINSFAVQTSRQIVFASIPYVPRVDWTVDHDGNVLWGFAERYEIVKQTVHGDTLSVWGRSIVPFPVSNVDRGKVVRRLAELGDTTSLDLDRIPSRIPFFEKLVPDPNGGLWVLRQGPSGTWFFDIFDSKGNFRGEALLPHAVDLLRARPVRSLNGIWTVTSAPGGEIELVRYALPDQNRVAAQSSSSSSTR